MRKSLPGRLPALSAAAFAALLAGRCAGAPAGPAVGPAEGAGHPMVGRLAPGFAVQDPSGPWIPSENFRDKPMALLLFRPGAPFAPELAREFSRMRADRSFVPVVFLGLVRDDSIETVRRFGRTHGIDMPLMRDPGAVARAFGVGDRPAAILVDGDGVVRFRLDGFAGPLYRPRLEAVVAAARALPRAAAEAGTGTLDLDWTENPRAPVFAARARDGRTFDLAKQRGKPVVLVFFDQECPHCDRDLPALLPVLRQFRPRGVAAAFVATAERGTTLGAFVKKHGIEFPVIVDEDRALFARYESTRTPDTFFIDGDGTVRFRERGDRPDRADLTRLQLRLLLGEAPAGLAAGLPSGRYAGDGVCRSCHLEEYRDWLMTPHSIAWDSLAQGEKWRDPECVGCHVTGKDRPGGFASPETTPHMVHVQCEVCHGMGGGHPAGSPAGPAMADTCDGCHTGKFVLNFDKGEALALMAHRERPDAAKLFKYSELQRRRLEQINTRRLEKFKAGVAYVGAEACRDCHRPQYDQWSRTRHAAAFAVLFKSDRGADRNCTPCHTTGAGRKGGFGDKDLKDRPMTHVQCEVCHGPGADHVQAPPALKKATVYGITDQCSVCIVQGVCLTCHDRRNDPDFDLDAALPLVTH
jgi:peroxiredoxin